MPSRRRHNFAIGTYTQLVASSHACIALVEVRRRARLPKQHAPRAALVTAARSHVHASDSTTTGLHLHVYRAQYIRPTHLQILPLPLSVVVAATLCRRGLLTIASASLAIVASTLGLYRILNDESIHESLNISPINCVEGAWTCDGELGIE
jgi:hypothetical protein